MKLIQLSKGKSAIVDDQDYEWLSKFTWYSLPKKSPKNYYAMRKEYHGRWDTRVFFMHRDILGLNGNKLLEGDHINGNGLDNRRRNLRIATRAQNKQNQRKRKNTKSKYKGVSPHGKKWIVKICCNGNRMNLGIFRSEKMAALAYDIKAKELFGQFARPNLLKTNQ